MTEVTETPVVEEVEQTELDKLKEYATGLGIEFHPNIGLEKLKERIDAAFPAPAVVQETPVEEPVEEIPAPSALINEQTPLITKEALEQAVADTKLASDLATTVLAAAVQETKEAKRYRLRKEATKLVRVNVMNMNPFRKEWEGDTYCVGNGVIGTIKRYVPFNTDWHVEQALLNVMEERKCQIFTTRKDRQTGQEVKTPRTIKELQIAILPPLTEKELKELAQRQAMAAGTQADED
ncbi:hypothetical protein HWB52_gp16 [Pseudomonas phage Littlefix]|uniref:Uncharacterized protein n=1 Tax=Pseudomonas phage Littlefix TaxID=2079289 RepID=A0A2K9VHJ9_9CAUD|nr:hypothetical protein HWB52_gp16 [Pseudomonas phage Littlefix]AUV61831.1 hypothetical protein PsPhLittlefix_gp16 [Pseudomonas phage Littlefix]